MLFQLIRDILSEEISRFSQRLIESLKRWLPYLLIWLANAAWLAYFYSIGGYASYEVEVVNEPLTVIHIISAVAEAIWKAGFYVWGQVLLLASKSIAAPTTLGTFALIIAAFILILFYLQKLDLSENNTSLHSCNPDRTAGILFGRPFLRRATSHPIQF
jgi:hypothetical protein